MMGFKYGKATWSYYKKTSKVMYGTGAGQIWLDEVDCEGDEFYIAACKHSLWGKVGCDHSGEAGVICSDNKLTDATSMQNDCASEKTLAERCAENPGDCPAKLEAMGHHEAASDSGDSTAAAPADASAAAGPFMANTSTPEPSLRFVERYFYGKDRDANGKLLPDYLLPKGMARNAQGVLTTPN